MSPVDSANPAASAAALPEVAPQPDDADAVVEIVQPSQSREGAVGRAVVDEDRLPRRLERRQGLRELVEERLDVVLLVVDGDDDRDHGCEGTRPRVAEATAVALREWPSSSTIAEALAAVIARTQPLGRRAGRPRRGARPRAARRVATAVVDLPPFPSSAMDGYAVRSTDTPGRLPVVAAAAAGRPADRPLAPGEAIGIATGAVVPQGADAVVPIEDVGDRDNMVEIPAAVAPGANIRPQGGDIRASAEVVAAGARLGAAHVGALAAAGVSEVACARRPRVRVLTTGIGASALR